MRFPGAESLGAEYSTTLGRRYRGSRLASPACLIVSRHPTPPLTLLCVVGGVQGALQATNPMLTNQGRRRTATVWGIASGKWVYLL
jgi:hypothetical protein